MATYTQIMEAVNRAMNAEERSVSATEIAKALGVKVSDINTSLTRLVGDKGWLMRNDEGNYSFSPVKQAEKTLARRIADLEGIHFVLPGTTVPYSSLRKIDQLKAILESQVGDPDSWTLLDPEIRETKTFSLDLVVEAEDVVFAFDASGEHLHGMVNYKE